MNRLGSLAAVAAVSLVAFSATTAQALSFFDPLTTTASPNWSNSSGAWAVSNGYYSPTMPNNAPTTYSGLPFDLTNFTVNVDAIKLGDGGIYLRSDGTNQNGVLLVLGGEGYGGGARGGNAGKAIYFHTIESGVFSSPMDEVTNVFTPGLNYAIKVVVSGNTYDAYVNNVLETSLTTSLFGHGMVGLYGAQPNTTTGNGSGAFSGFNNFGVTSVPEPSAWALMLAGFGVLGGALRRRVRRTATA